MPVSIKYYSNKMYVCFQESDDPDSEPLFIPVVKLDPNDKENVTTAYHIFKDKNILEKGFSTSRHGIVFNGENFTYDQENKIITVVNPLEIKINDKVTIHSGTTLIYNHANKELKVSGTKENPISATVENKKEENLAELTYDISKDKIYSYTFLARKQPPSPRKR